MKTFCHVNIALFLLACFFSGCVMSSTHEALKKQFEETELTLKNTRDQKDNLTDEKNDCQTNLKYTTEERDKVNSQLVAKNMQIDTLVKKKGKLSEAQKKLMERQKKLAEQVYQLERLKKSAEARNADYRNLLKKLHKMIDAGTLQVKIRNGRMLVQMSSDVVFPSGSVKIKAAAKEAIYEIAQSISSFPDRKFQVVGHSDPTPIKTAKFPSNWELSSHRATEVVKLMIEAGVPPEMLSAAGCAEFDPLIENDTPENKKINRRVEIVFLPKIDELPGFDQALSKK